MPVERADVGSERRFVRRFLTHTAKSTKARVSAALVALFLLAASCLGAPEAGAETNEFELGLEAARAGNCDRAIELWTRVIQRNPRSYAALVNRGSAFRQSGHIFKAISDWHEARKWSPLFAFGVYSGDYIAQASGDASMLNFVSPLELEPDHVPSVLMTGILFTEIGYPSMAAELYRKSVDLTRNPMLKAYLDYLADNLFSSARR